MKKSTVHRKTVDFQASHILFGRNKYAMANKINTVLYYKCIRKEDIISKPELVNFIKETDEWMIRWKYMRYNGKDMRPDEYKIVENRPEYVSIKRGNRWIIIACYPD